MNRKEKVLFTLIELLVVIAIIAILAGMLLPSLNKSLETARGKACLNTTKQFGGVILNYTDDYNCWVPGSYTLGGYYNSAGHSSNSYVIRDLIPLYKGTLPPLSLKSEFWFCPSLPGKGRTDMANYAKSGVLGFLSNYGINCYVNDNGYSQGNIRHLRAPSRTAAVGDNKLNDQGNNKCIGNLGLNGLMPDIPEYRPLRHGSRDTANFMFWDGHSESRKYTQYPNMLLTTDESKLNNSYFWNRYGYSNLDFLHM